MSSSEESDDDAFESADEDVDSQQYGHQFKDNTVVDNKVTINKDEVNKEMQPNLTELHQNDGKYDINKNENIGLFF